MIFSIKIFFNQNLLFVLGFEIYMGKICGRFLMFQPMEWAIWCCAPFIYQIFAVSENRNSFHELSKSFNEFHVHDSTSILSIEWEGHKNTVEKYLFKSDSCARNIAVASDAHWSLNIGQYNHKHSSHFNR